MSPAPSYLRNTEAVVKAFGYWPSFHDAPVFDFRYVADGSSVIGFILHTWEMTSEVDERGYFKSIKHHLIQFAFREISDADLERFTSMGNILFELGFSTAEEFEANGKFKVDLDSAIGGNLCGSFFARTGEVVEVAPCDKQGRRTEPAHAA
jgi:Immunity protein 50